MVVCQVCGKANRADAKVCGKCGAKLSPPSVASTATEPPKPRLGLEDEGRFTLYKRDDVRRFVGWLLKGNENIRPQRDPRLGDYTYTNVESNRLLSELESHGILEKYSLDTVAACPSCQHSNFYVDYVCPFSRHRSLERGIMIEHYTCGHTDFESNFTSGNELICPKCKRALKLVGTDYRKTDQVFHCSGCKRFFGTPLIELTCRSCTKVIKQDEAVILPVYGYRLKEELRSELVAHCTLETQIINLFQKKGFEVTSPKVVRGLSGIEHTFDMQATREGTEFVLDLISVHGGIGPEKIVGFYTKIFDSKPSNAVLIAIPKLNEEAQKLSALYNVQTIAAERTDEILSKLSMLLERPPTPETKVIAERPQIPEADEILSSARSRMKRAMKNAEEQVVK